MASSRTVKEHACRIDTAQQSIVFEESAQAIDVPMGDSFKIQTLWKITPAISGHEFLGEGENSEPTTHVKEVQNMLMQRLTKACPATVMSSVAFVKPVKFIQGQITNASLRTMEEATAQFVECCTSQGHVLQTSRS
eukprot:scaffold236_cov419-Prasinococcus_capsulatus_cf.AAC.8